MGQPLRPLLRLKVEVEARSSAGTDPTAGHLESVLSLTYTIKKSPTRVTTLIEDFDRHI